MIESGFALMVAFLINVSVISVSGAVCNSSNLNPEDKASCEDLDLNKASFLLRVCYLATPFQYFMCPFDPYVHFYQIILIFIRHFFLSEINNQMFFV